MKGFVIEITYKDTLIFITVMWILLRILFGIINRKVDFIRELRLLTVYICIVVIVRYVYFPLELKNGHVDTLILNTDKILPFMVNFTPIIHMFDEYDEWLINILGNIAMFIPVGVCWPFCFKKLDKVWKAVLAGGGFSLFIEITQLVFYSRCSDIDDLIMNTTGVLIGAVLYFFVRDRLKGELKLINKNIIWAILSSLLAVLTIRIMLKLNKDMSLSMLMSTIASSDKLFFIIGAIAAALYVWFEGVAIRSILKHAGFKQGIFKGLVYSTSDVYFSAITPSATGGQPASAFFMMRDGIPGGMATATLVLNLMMYTISIVVLGVIAIFVSPRAFMEFGKISKILILVGFIALSILSLLFFVLLKKEEIIFTPLSKIVRFLYNKGIVKEKDKILVRIEKAENDYKACSDMISGRKRILFAAFIWNFLQRASQILVPMFIYRSLGGETGKMATVFSKQCLITIGYNFIPIPGGMGISDYLMIDGFYRVMGEQMAYSVELISRGITFYICVTISGIITLIGYMIGRKKK
ncbi:MAG: flippase-like domain-containing protein [Eubacterium sp.]|nr:flippase-like domain-containing protein [Eubacterium sp.]